MLGYRFGWFTRHRYLALGKIAAILFVQTLAAYGQNCTAGLPPKTKPAVDHFADFEKDTLVGSNLALTLLTPAASAAVSQYFQKEPGYRPGTAGLPEHYADSIADTVDGKFVRDFVFPTIFKQNPHYSPMQGNCQWTARIVNVLRYSVITPHGNLNWSAMPASAVLAGLSDLYVPSPQRTWQSTLIRFGTNAGGRIAGDAFQEFCPNIKRFIPFLPCPK